MSEATTDTQTEAAMEDPAALPFSEDLEAWLKVAVGRDEYGIDAIVEAMVGDGYPVERANVLASAAIIRFGRASLEECFAERTAAQCLGQRLRKHLPGYLHSARPAKGPLPSLWDPLRQRDRNIALGDREVPILMVCESPRLALIGSLFSEEDCHQLIELARERLQTDMIVDRHSQLETIDQTVRSSSGCCFGRGEFPWIDRLVERVAQLVRVPVEHCELLSVSQYAPGNQFALHTDYLEASKESPKAAPEASRIATVVVYLNDVEEGGETLFPSPGLRFRPSRGGALYFSYLRPDGSGDPASAHAGSVAARGQKWIATLWFHSQPVAEDDERPA